MPSHELEFAVTPGVKCKAMTNIRFPAKATFVLLAVFSTIVLIRFVPPGGFAATAASRLGWAVGSVGSVPEPQQFPIVDAIANKIVQKYQSSTCEQLWQEKAQAKNKPKSPQEQEAISILHNDSQMRAEFINKIAAPVANKMFECGMIP